jgi:hypothetical protein
MVSVPASEVQKNFGAWHDKAHEGPVEITRYGRSTAYLVSAKLFDEMWACFRKAVSVNELSESDMMRIAKSSVQTDAPYTLAEIPEDPEHAPPSP